MLLFDIETDGFLHELTKVHCLVIRETATGAVSRFRGDDIPNGLRILMHAPEHGEVLTGHNVIKFDIPALKKVYPFFNVDESKVLDTLVLSRLIYAELQDWDTKLVKKQALPSKHFKKHSLEAWGFRLGERKIDYLDWCQENGITEPWAVWRQEMEDYCVGDTATNLKLLQKLLEVIAKDEWSQQAIDLEHQVQWIIARQERRGIRFFKDKATDLLVRLAKRKLELEVELREAFPPFYKRDKEFTPARDNKAAGYTAGVPLTKVKLTPFNPGSRDHIALCLHRRFGWEPTEFTSDGKPKIDESVLANLKYPEAVLLREYLTVDKRIGQLADGDQAWLKHERNGRIHGGVVTNGAVTGRMTHANPNLAQVPASYSPWGHECRECFGPGEGYVQVGADADALELRDFAGYLAFYDGGAYIEAVLRGDKKAGTDSHSVNARALGLDPKATYFDGESGRDIAKTWFYAFLYGAGDEKLGLILSRKKRGARQVGAAARDRFLKALPALGKLVKAVKTRAKQQGWLKGLDGRRIFVRSQHAALNTLLQCAGAVQMKQALVIFDADLQAAGLVPGVDYEFIANVHDEWQLEVKPEIADDVGKMAVQAIRKAGEALNFRCPLDGEYKVGRNWAETH